MPWFLAICSSKGPKLVRRLFLCSGRRFAERLWLKKKITAIREKIIGKKITFAEAARAESDQKKENKSKWRCF
jgi:hypothetical protein